jgi:hypothetical protein
LGLLFDVKDLKTVLMTSFVHAKENKKINMPKKGERKIEEEKKGT